MSKSLAVELAPWKIRVNAICPVMGVTGMLEDFMGVPDTPENRAKFIATIPLGRLSTAAGHRRGGAVPRGGGLHHRRRVAGGWRPHGLTAAAGPHRPQPCDADPKPGGGREPRCSRSVRPS